MPAKASFIPLIIVIFYVNDEKKVEDILKSKKPIWYVLGAIVVSFTLLAVISHVTYSKSSTMDIVKITPIIYGNAGFVGPFSLGGVIVTMRNNADYSQPVSFYIASRNPSGYEYILNSSLNETLSAHSTMNYTLRYNLQLVNNNTTLYVSAFNQHYISTEKYRITTP